MKNHHHRSNNTLAGAPPGWDDKHGALELPTMRVTRGQIAKHDVYVSWWKPTPEELGMLLRGGLVQLSCIGGQPACNVTTVASEDTPVLLAN